MNLTTYTTTARAWNRGLAAIFAAMLFALPMPVLAHKGFEHIMGTVVKTAGSVLTVKTAKGDVDVKLDSKTEFTRDGNPARPVDLKPGLRVVVEVPEGGTEKVAHSVKIGAAAKPVPNTHK